MKKHRQYLYGICFVFSEVHIWGGVLVTERAERLARLVGGEDLVAEAELLVPEL